MNNYKELLKKVSEYKDTRFWENITGDDIFKIKGYKRNIYVSIMGNANMDYGIAIFNGEEELYSQLDVSYGEYEHFPDTFNRLNMYKLQLFDVGYMLDEQDKERLSKNRIKSKDHFFKFESGYLPRLVDEEEALLLTKVLDDIISISKYLKDKKIDFMNNYYLEEIFAFEIKDGNVKHSKGIIPNKYLKKIQTEKPNEDKLNQLLLTKHTGTYHIGLFYSPFLVKGKREYYPLMLFVIDGKTNYILDAQLMQKEDVRTLPNMLLNLFAKMHTVPENISFSDSTPFLLCQELIFELKIKYTINNNDNALFEAWEAMANGMFSK